MTRNILWFWHWGTVQLLTKHSHIWFFSRHTYIWYFNVSNMKVNFQFSWEKTNYCFEWAWCFKMCSAVKKSHREGGESVVIPMVGLFSLICTFFLPSLMGCSLPFSMSGGCPWNWSWATQQPGVPREGQSAQTQTPLCSGTRSVTLPFENMFLGQEERICMCV